MHTTATTRHDACARVPPTLRARIAAVVQQQRSSADFASLVVAHVTDERMHFLYALPPAQAQTRRRSRDDAHAAARQCYVQQLQRAQDQQQQQQHVVCGGSEGGDDDSSSSASRSGHDDGRRRRRRARSRASSCDRDASSTSMALTSSLSWPSRRDVQCVWRRLRRSVAVVTTSSDDDDDDDSDDATRRVRVLTLSPHAPHVFASAHALAAFVRRVCGAAQQPRRDDVHGVVQYMLQRLTMTECFVYTLVCLLQQRLRSQQQQQQQHSPSQYGSHDTTRRVRRRHHCRDARNDDDKDDDDDVCTRAHGVGGVALRDSEAAASDSSTASCIEAAGTLFYMLAALLAAHRDREARLREAAHGSAATSTTRAAAATTTRPCGAGAQLYYQRVFDVYGVKAVRAIVAAATSAAAPTPQPIDGHVQTRPTSTYASLTSYVRETAAVWCDEACLSPDATAQLRRVVAVLHT